jgi:hypothetical protein
MKAAQHLALLQPVSKATVTTSFTTSFTQPRQGASLIVVGLNRPVTGRNALVEMEGEDYDGQSGVTKEDSGDATTVGQSIAGGSGSSVFFDNVDFSDAGVGAVALRVNAAAATTLQLRADSQTGTLLGTCQVSATSGAWATQTCTLTPTTGVHTLYVVFGGAVRLNYLKFQPATGGTGTGGMGGGGTGGGTAGTSGAGGRTTGGAGTGGGASGGTTGAAGATGSAGSVGTAGTTGSGAGTAGTTGTDTGIAGTMGSGAGAAGTTGSGTGAAGTTGVTGGGKSGCSCDIGDARGQSRATLVVALFAAVFGLRGRRARRRR